MFDTEKTCHPLIFQMQQSQPERPLPQMVSLPRSRVITFYQSLEQVELGPIGFHRKYNRIYLGKYLR